jgi:hypothetical protein
LKKSEPGKKDSARRTFSYWEGSEDMQKHILVFLAGRLAANLAQLTANLDGTKDDQEGKMSWYTRDAEHAFSHRDGS